MLFHKLTSQEPHISELLRSTHPKPSPIFHRNNLPPIHFTNFQFNCLNRWTYVFQITRWYLNLSSMRAHKNTFYFLQLIGYSVILLYFYAIGLLFLGFGSLSDGHYLYKQRYFLFYLCRLAYVFLDSIPSFLCE